MVFVSVACVLLALSGHVAASISFAFIRFMSSENPPKFAPIDGIPLLEGYMCSAAGVDIVRRGCKFIVAEGTSSLVPGLVEPSPLSGV